MLVKNPNLTEVLPLFRALHNFHVCLLPSVFHAEGTDAELMTHLQEMQSEGAVIYAVDAGWGLVGYLLAYAQETKGDAFRRAANRMTIDHLYVAPTHRGRGLGPQLIAALEADMLAKGQGNWRVGQEAANLPATEFYVAVGARPRVLFLEKRL